MRNKTIKMCVTALLLASASANATIQTVFDGISAGVADFDATVTGAGATVSFDIWAGLSSGTSIDRGDYVITQNDGGFGSVTTYGDTSGQVIGIDPSGGGTNPRTDPLDYFDSGITFTFDSAVNAVGFEVGDWATCCTSPTTDLFMSFDGGNAIQVATANQGSDGQFPSQANPQSSVYEIFVAAFDDSGDFTQVSFWGNGIGEFLVAGGQLRYALLDRGTLPPAPGNPVSAPTSLGIFAFASFALFLRRRVKK